MRDYAFPIIGGMEIRAVDTPAVLRVLEPVWLEKPSVGNMLRLRLEAILKWAKSAGYREGENPARWKEHLDNLLPSHVKIAPQVHHPALEYQDVPKLMAELAAVPTVPAQALRFLTLTAARVGEVTGATWDEIDLEAKVWVIPASRMKANRELRIPLSDAAVAILEGIYKESGNAHVFLGARTGSRLSDSMLLLTLKKLRPSTTVHGLRSSFRDWAGNETIFQRETIEAALAHIIGDKAEQAYRRSDALEKRRALMESWAMFCGGTPS